MGAMIYTSMARLVQGGPRGDMLMVLLYHLILIHLFTASRDDILYSVQLA